MSINKHFRIRNGLSVNTAGSNATVEIAANDAILLPRGASGERPATAANGMFRYNTTSNGFEGYIAGAWTALTDATTASDMETTTYDPAGVAEQLVGLTAIQTLTNKTLTSPTLTSPTINTSVALPANAVDAITEIAAGIKSGTDGTLITGTSGTSTHLAQWDVNGDLVTAGKAAPSGAIVGTTDSQTLTNKTLTSPTINTSVALPSNAVDAIGEISASIRSGSDATLITGTAGTNGSLAQWDINGDLVTLAAPAGSLVGTTATQTLTNKTLTSPIINTSISLPSNAVDAIGEIASGLKSGLDSTLITGTAGTNGSLAQWNTDGDLVTLAAPSGSLVGTTATQTLTNKTLTSPVLTTPRVSSGTMNVQSGSITIGVNDSVPGFVSIYGGGTTETSGVLRIYNSADGDNGNIQYWQMFADSGGAFILQTDAGDAALRVDDTTDQVTIAPSNGQVYIGSNDSVPAELHLYGGGAGEAGGEFFIYNGADDDASAEYFQLYADTNGNLTLARFPPGGPLAGMTYWQASDGKMVVSSGNAEIGLADNTPGILSVMGGGAAEASGELRVYNNADDDGVLDYWRIFGHDGTGSLRIQGSAGAMGIGFSANSTQPRVMGQLALSCTPGGRLTMVTNDRQIGSDSNGTTIYYTPALHNRIPIFNGSEWELAYFAEITNVTTNATSNPAATVADTNYDFFVWDDGGTIKISRGPAWTSNTGRGTGAGTTELGQQDTIYVNAVNITNGPAAGTGTYVGTARTNGSNNWQLRRLATGSTGNETLWMAVYNFYNKICHTFHSDPSGGSYTYNSTSHRTYAGNTNLRHGFINGSPTSGLYVFAHFYTYTGSGNSGNNRQNIGFGIDGNSYEGTSGVGRGPNQTAGHHIAIHGTPVMNLGWRRLYMVENADNTGGAYTSYPNDTTMSGVVVM